MDTTATYDDRRREPTVLPSRVPNLLVNGSAGIAVGMATNIPPHNLGEVIDACLAMIDNPEIDVDGLMQHVKAPDVPTAGQIVGLTGVREAYRTGRGRVVVRTADMDIEAGEFELDVPSQIGVATAEEGRLVTLVRRGSAMPMRAHAFRWDMVKGTISVQGARGAIGR